MQVEPSLIVDIKFQRPKRGRDVGTCQGEASAKPTKTPKLKPHTQEAENGFLRGLESILPSAVFFSSHQPNCNTSSSSDTPIVRKLPPTLLSLKKPKYASMTDEQLKEACKDVFTSGITVTLDEASYLEECTRLQSQSLIWFEHRTGRITASKFLAVKRASLHPPPASLIKELMERNASLSHVAAVRWGMEHEDVARNEYFELASESHKKFSCALTGLHVNPCYPHLGATPDGLIECDCCGEGVLEVKCPFKHRDKHPHDAVVDLQYCLRNDDDGTVHLRCDHQYYYQVQGQLAICEKEYCDFVCWTPHGIHIERILADPLHFSDTKVALDEFFLQVMLPLLLTGREHVGVSDSTSCSGPQLDNQTQDLSHKTYCWCNGDDIGRMVACENSTCPKEWFHFQCVGLKRKPRGKWYCSDSCRNSKV